MELLFLLLVLVCAGAVANLFEHLHRLRAELVRQRRALQRVAAALGAPPDPLDEEVAELLSRGDREAARRRIREALRLPASVAEDYLDQF